MEPSVEVVPGYDPFASFCGTAAAVSFFLVQIPQIYLNFMRKSTVGFSWEAIIIRTFGISFHVVNGIVAAMNFPLLLTGFLLLTEMFVILAQFALYREDRRFYIAFLIPIVPVMMSLIWPVTMEYTNYINPITQIACYIPFLYECVRVGTTHGIYTKKPVLDLDRITKIRQAIDIPFVMHGGSGLSKEEFQTAIQNGIRKINYYTYMTLAGGKAVKEAMDQKGADENVFFHDIPMIAVRAMKENVKQAIRVFSMEV